MSIGASDSINFDSKELLGWLEVPACVLDAIGVIGAANGAFADLMRGTSEQFVGVKLLSLCADRDDLHIELLAGLSEVQYADTKKQFSINMQATDGSVIAVVVKTLPCQDATFSLVSLIPVKHSIDSIDSIESSERMSLHGERVFLEYQAIMVNAPVGIGFSRDRKILRYNKKFEQIFGFSGQEGVGQSTITLYESQQVHAVVSGRATPLLSKGKPFEEEMLMRRQDNTTFWAHAVAYLVDANDPAQGTIWIISDINSRKFSEAQLSNTLLELQAIIENASVGIFFTQNRHFQRCNQRGANIFGYEPHELIGHSSLIIYPDIESYQQLGYAAGPRLVAGENFLGDWQYKKKDGTLIWCRVYAKALDPRNTEFGTVWIFDDITQNRAIEQAFKQSLSEMESLMRNASVGILITKDKRMMSYNPMFAQMFGFDGDAGVGRLASDLYRTPQEYIDLGAQAIPLFLQAKPFKTELFMRCQDGSDLWVNLIGYVADTKETSRATFWILEDRTAFKTAERALQQAQHELVQQEKLAALGSLVVGVAHELNTPIGNAMTAASTMHDNSLTFLNDISLGQLRRSQLDSFLHNLSELSGLVARSCERAAQLVTGFKQMAVERSNEMRSVFNLRSVLDDSVATQQRIMDVSAPMLCHISHDLVSDIECDSYPQALTEVITNIIENARKHAFVGRQRGNLKVLVVVTESIEIRFLDDGIGMDTAVLVRVFDPFFTTRLGQGRSGLGLSITRNLVNTVLGGELSVESEPGRGSCFFLRFPRRQT
jgi:PAS domain S-box-containing protein